MPHYGRPWNTLIRIATEQNLCQPELPSFIAQPALSGTDTVPGSGAKGSKSHWTGLVSHPCPRINALVTQRFVSYLPPQILTIRLKRSWRNFWMKFNLEGPPLLSTTTENPHGIRPSDQTGSSPDL